MRIRCLRTVLLFFFLLVTLTAAAQSKRSVPGRILVKPKAHLTEADFSARLQAQGAVHRTFLRHSNVRVVSLAEERTESALAALRNDPDIEFAEPDYVAQASFVPNDPYVASSSEWHLAKIQALQAWDIATGRVDVIIAVLDSGVNPAHPDLAGQLLPGYNFVSNNSDPADDFGHGTAVTGTLVAIGNNGIGVAGVAYGCRVLPVKVMDASGMASHSCIAQGIEFAVQQGARVINLSMGGDWPSSTLQDAINYAWNNNVVVVASAGNTGGTVPQYPAACDHVVAVAASAPDDSRCWFSSYGSFVTLFAPGENIWTTQRDLTRPYAAWSGTSFSSPVVAAVAALAASVDPALSNDQLVDILKQTADDLGAPGYDPVFAYGRVNAFQAVSLAWARKNGGGPPSATAPNVILANPADGVRLPFGASVTLAATVSSSVAGVLITNVQFFANGLPLANLAARPFGFDWLPDQAGSFALAAVATDNQGLSATSAPVSIHIAVPDLIPPTLTVMPAPPNGARLASPFVTLTGMARDGTGVDRVEIQLNDGLIQLADGTTNWSAQIVLTPGPNVVRVRSVDKAGNGSAPITRIFTYVVTAPLVVEINGLGMVTPDLNGRELEIGRTYRVWAVPGPGQVFAGWNGSVSPALHFVMQSNLTLVANFVTNPFPVVQGAYAGLVANTNRVTPDTSGYFVLRINSFGRFSGKLLRGGERHGFTGALNLAGDAAVTVRRASLVPVNLLLHLDLANPSDQVAGTVDDGTFTAVLAGDRNVFDSRLNPAQQAGSRSFLLEYADTNVTVAANARSHILASGLAAVHGKLADGRPFTTLSFLGKNGDYPFYVPLNRGTEVVIGWLNFPAPPALTVNGTALWVNSGTNAFSAPLKASPAPP